jgi:hypothetical protein
LREEDVVELLVSEDQSVVECTITDKTVRETLLSGDVDTSSSGTDSVGVGKLY